MKGFKVAALAAVALCFVATSVLATDFAAGHMKTKELRFRSHAAATVSPVDFMGGYVDSAVASRLGTQICPLDTSAAISTSGWTPLVPAQATADSGTFAVLNVFDATGSACASAADSLYIAIQGSLNGANWTTLRTFKDGTISTITSRLDQTNVTGAFQGLISLNGASQAGGGSSSLWRYKIPIGGANQGAAMADRYSTNTWPLIRFIIGFPDAVKYQVGASITHVSTLDE